MSASIKCSVIINVYNQARQLRLVLESASWQTDRAFELVLADDGSSDDTGEVIEAFRRRHARIPIQHVRHEDRGFRRTVILNQAAREARGDYLVFIDGDMILHPKLVANHLLYRQARRINCAYRGVKLGPRYTEVLLEGSRRFNPALWRLLLRGALGEVNRPWRGWEIHQPWIRKVMIKPKSNLPGCHFAMEKKAYERVNGMDETIQEYGYEDYELGHRLQLAGFQIANVRNCCITYHLHHRQTILPDVETIKERIRANPYSVCKHGFRELKEGSTNEMFHPRPAPSV